jgi:hypothetical protein
MRIYLLLFLGRKKWVDKNTYYKDPFGPLISLQQAWYKIIVKQNSQYYILLKKATYQHQTSTEAPIRLFLAIKLLKSSGFLQLKGRHFSTSSFTSNFDERISAFHKSLKIFIASHILLMQDLSRRPWIIRVSTWASVNLLFFKVLGFKYFWMWKEI